MSYPLPVDPPVDLDAPIGGPFRLPKGISGFEMQKLLDVHDEGAVVGSDLLIYFATNRLLYCSHQYGWDLVPDD